MVRAGVFIGVDMTGELQVLKDAAAGAERMYNWALSQGMDPSRAKLITDSGGGKVQPDHIYDVIEEIVDGPGVDQLILYFAGHGVNINRNEHWLLSDAPRRTSAAINVSGSVELARYCGIRHVVIFSDACRVAPEGIQAQNVRGLDVFPNEGAADRASPVDQFFACALGKTAAEIPYASHAALNYTALYTDALLDALKGERSDVLDTANTSSDLFYYVWPRKLEAYLEGELPRRVKALQLEKKINQNPDAIITSHANWLACIDPATTRAEENFKSKKRLSPPASLQSIAGNLARYAADDNQPAFDRYMKEARIAPVVGAEQLVKTIERFATAFGPAHFETQCGIKVRGAHIAGFYSPGARAEPSGPAGNALQIDLTGRSATSVLIHFGGGTGTVIPAVSGYIAALTFEDGELVQVAYEPSSNHWRWQDFERHAAEARRLRAVAGAATEHGRLNLAVEDAISIARTIQSWQSVDPALAVYLAYAWHDLQDIDRIRDMSGLLEKNMGFTFFDLALLGRELVDQQIEHGAKILPFFPLLSRGWALLGANRVRLHPALDGIEHTMRDSLWSLFDSRGLEKLAQVMQPGR